MTVYGNHHQGMEALYPLDSGFSITAHDSNTVSPVPRCVYVGGAGDLVVRLKEDDSGNITFSNVPAGTFLPIVPELILSTGTTATNILGFD